MSLFFHDDEDSDSEFEKLKRRVKKLEDEKNGKDEDTSLFFHGDD